MIFDVINEDMIFKAARMTKGGSGPSGIDSDGWKRILTSKDYGDANRDLRRALALMIKSICTESIDDNSLEPLLASRLVPLDKKPGVRPIGVGEVLRRIMGKVVMGVFAEDVTKSSSKSQMCGHKSGSEAAIHAMRRMFQNNNTDAVILVDAANAFNNLNRKVLLHNIRYVCPEISMYVINCYSTPARLFVIGGCELKSAEGTTQGDPLGMAVYAIGITPLMDLLIVAMENDHNKMVGFADDITAAGDLDSLKKWWEKLLQLGPRYGYFPQPSKSWLIVKEERVEEALNLFSETNIQITCHGERHLGAVIGTAECKKKYVEDLVSKWCKEISLLAEVGTTYPQAAYTAYVAGYQHKLTYFLRTIPSIENEMEKVDEIVRHRLIPPINGGHIINDQERVILSLPPRLGGMGLKVFAKAASTEHQNSTLITAKLQDQILGVDGNNDDNTARTKYQLRNERRNHQQAEFEVMLNEMNAEMKRKMEALTRKGASNWLTTLPIKERGYALTKQEFWDAVCLRYNWPIERIPNECACGQKFDVSHALSCKLGGFVTLRHNEVRDITAELLKDVCTDVRKEPLLIEPDLEDLPRQANRTREARLDVSARNFWTTGQRAFFDIRVFNLDARRHRNTEVEKCFERNEKEKKTTVR